MGVKDSSASRLHAKPLFCVNAVCLCFRVCMCPQLFSSCLVVAGPSTVYRLGWISISPVNCFSLCLVLCSFDFYIFIGRLCAANACVSATLGECWQLISMHSHIFISDLVQAS